MTPTAILARRVLVEGHVQGVGYRDWTLRTARGLGLSGWVRNRADGSLEALLVGEETAVGRMIDACRRGPALARVDDVDIDPVDLDVLPEGFTQLPTA